MLRKRQERKAASASTSTFRPDSPANRPLVSNTGRYSLSSLLKERQEKIRTGRTLEHIQAILDVGIGGLHSQLDESRLLSCHTEQT